MNRPEIRGIDRIPAAGPVLLVGNHSGGNVAPDTLVLADGFSCRLQIDQLGGRRPVHLAQLLRRQLRASSED